MATKYITEQDGANQNDVRANHKLFVDEKLGVGTTNPTSPLCIAGYIGLPSTSFASFGDRRWYMKQYAGDEENAGCIDYGSFEANSLSIVGKGNDPTARKVRIYDELYLNGNFSFREHYEPSDPPANCAVLWMSSGTGAGDEGDIMMKINDGSTTKTHTLVDFSAI